MSRDSARRESVILLARYLNFGLAVLWVPRIRSWALTRGYALHPGTSCVAFCTGSSRCWHGWLCARDARRTLRSLCCATRSRSFTDRTTDQRSPSRTGPCWALSRQPCRDRSEPAGSSHQRPCWAGTEAASPAAGPVPAGRPGGPAPVWRILKQHGVDPAPQPTSVTWTQFLGSQAAVACGFATVDTALLRRCCVLLCIDITTREVLHGAITANPTGAGTTQAARNLFVRHPQRLTQTRALLRDRASQSTGDSDEILRTEGLKILRTPVRVPVANAFAERWIGILRREVLDPTARSTNDPQHHTARRAPTPQRLSESPTRHDATDSSTSTDMRPDQPRHNFGHPQAQTTTP